MKTKILDREDALIADEVSDVEIYLFLLRKNKMENDILH